MDQQPLQICAFFRSLLQIFAMNRGLAQLQTTARQGAFAREQWFTYWRFS
jgi:hypothetical protein